LASFGNCQITCRGSIAAALPAHWSMPPPARCRRGAGVVPALVVDAAAGAVPVDAAAGAVPAQCQR